MVYSQFCRDCSGCCAVQQQEAPAIAVTLSNITSNSVVIDPKCINGKLQYVTIDTVSDDCSDSDVDVLTQVHMGEDGSEKERLDLCYLLERHRDVFSYGDTEIGGCTVMKHRIELTNTIPFNERHSRNPPAMAEEVTSHLEDLFAS